MAEGRAMTDADLDPLKRKKARNLRELFHGRLTESEAYTLLRKFEWDVHRTTTAILNAGPGELADLLNSSDVEGRVAVVTRDEVLRDLAQRNEIGDTVRQFACADCNHMWWRRVPSRKQVSECKKCQRKYDPVPRDQEWGLAEFECSCGNTFRGTGAMGKAESECFKCGILCQPERILPPHRRKWRRTDKPHTCTGENCYNRRGGQHHGDTCVHPKSHPERVLVASQPHVSSGSTVDTFLDQDDLDSNFEPSLADISEDIDLDD